MNENTIQPLDGFHQTTRTITEVALYSVYRAYALDAGASAKVFDKTCKGTKTKPWKSFSRDDCIAIAWANLKAKIVKRGADTATTETLAKIREQKHDAIALKVDTALDKAIEGETRRRQNAKKQTVVDEETANGGIDTMLDE